MVRKSYPVERNEGRWVWVDPPPVPHSAFAFPGWMHSGYPIMCHLESVSELIDEMGMRSLGLWGPVHELGHNQQRKEWELPPHTTEATCNLWSVYVHETVLGIPRAQAHPALSPPERENRIKTHLKKGAPLCDWGVWTALETYLQVLSRNSGRWVPPGPPSWGIPDPRSSPSPFHPHQPAHHLPWLRGGASQVKYL